MIINKIEIIFVFLFINCILIVERCYLDIFLKGKFLLIDKLGGKLNVLIDLNVLVFLGFVDM